MWENTDRAGRLSVLMKQGPDRLVPFDTPHSPFHYDIKREDENMTYKNSFRVALCAGAMIALAACAATPKSTEAVKYAEPQNEKEAAILAANDLSASKTVSKSADGNVKCKFEPVVGSNFRRKICMTQDQWDKMAAESQKTTGDIQRRKGPGVNH